MAATDPARAALARAIVGAIDWLSSRRVRVPADLMAFKLANVQTFAAPDPAPALRGPDTGRKPKAIAAVNAYQTELQDAYNEWADKLATDLDAADDSDREKVIAAAVAALLLLLKRKGAESLPQAAALGFGSATSDAAKALIAKQIAENESYLTDSLGPDLKARAMGAFEDDDILGAMEAGGGAAALAGLMKGATARVGSYAGQFWKAYNESVGEASQEAGADGQPKRIRWVLDAQADHCKDCIEFGDTDYDSYQDLLDTTGGVTPASGVECGANCRCHLEEID